MNKKTKFTRIAVSGPTIDGRQITAQQIDEMAASYNVATYKANIWMEHLRGMYPGGDFGCYGHVLSLKAEDFEVNGTKQRALYAEMEVTPALIEWNAKNQKKGFSIEITPKFAETNQAYLSGLAVTDSPASLGTESLQFNIQVRKEPEHLFTTALEFTGIDYAEGEDQTGVAIIGTNERGLLKYVKGLFDAYREQTAPQPVVPPTTEPKQFNFGELESVLNKFAEKQDEVIAKITQENKTLSDAFNALQNEFNSLKQTPAPNTKTDFVDGSGTTTELINY